MIGTARIRAAWQRIDAERAAVVERRMRAPVTSAGGVAAQLGRDGAAWLEELGRQRGGIGPDDVEEVAQQIGATAAPNMLALNQAGAITPLEAILGGVGAGVGVALLLGYDLAVERVRELEASGDLDPYVLRDVVNALVAPPEGN